MSFIALDVLYYRYYSRLISAIAPMTRRISSHLHGCHIPRLGLPTHISCQGKEKEKKKKGKEKLAGCHIGPSIPSVRLAGYN